VLLIPARGGGGGGGAGLDPKASVRLATDAPLPAFTAAGSGIGKTLTANANGALTVDGVAVALNNRVAVKDEATSDPDHGIYTVTQVGSGSLPWILTRATDADQDSEVTAGMFFFVTEGTVNGDTGWILVTNDPIVVDTTPLQFSEFTRLGAVVAGAGLIKILNTIAAELHTTADLQGAGADGGTSGLELDVTGVAGKMRAKVDPIGGIQRQAAGLALDIILDTDGTIVIDSDGEFVDTE